MVRRNFRFSQVIIVYPLESSSWYYDKIVSKSRLILSFCVLLDQAACLGQTWWCGCWAVSCDVVCSALLGCSHSLWARFMYQHTASDPAPCWWPRRSMLGWHGCLGPWHQHVRPGRSSCYWLAQPSPGHCGHLDSQSLTVTFKQASKQASKQLTVCGVCVLSILKG